MSSIGARAIWISEHYWPGVSDELVFAQSQRLAEVPGWIGSIVLSGQETVLGCYMADSAAHVEAALAAVGIPSGAVGPGWAVNPAGDASTGPVVTLLRTLESP